jgi:hypothetical protein
MVSTLKKRSVRKEAIERKFGMTRRETDVEAP